MVLLLAERKGKLPVAGKLFLSGENVKNQFPNFPRFP
jgi:hypothetical protein